SPRSAAAKTLRRPAPPAKARPARAEAKPAAEAGNGAGSAEAKRLAAEIERALASGRRDGLSGEALQALRAARCKTYAAPGQGGARGKACGGQVQAGEELLPLPQRGGATATDVMITASGLLKAANLAVFELGMWQSWTGR